MYSKMGY